MSSILNRVRDLLRPEPATSSESQSSSASRSKSPSSKPRGSSQSPRSSPKRVKSPSRRNSLTDKSKSTSPNSIVATKTTASSTPTNRVQAAAARAIRESAPRENGQREINTMPHVAPAEAPVETRHAHFQAPDVTKPRNNRFASDETYDDDMSPEPLQDDGTPLESAGPPLVMYPYLSRYKMLSQMGEGAFSIVYKALDTQTKRMVAVKLVAKAQLNDQQRNNILREVSLLRRISHPNIIRLIDFHDTPIHYALILELMVGGEIFHQLVKKTCFSEAVCRHIITQVAEGIRYLHVERGVVHRDIKLENLLYEAPDARRVVPGAAADPNRYNQDEDYDDDDFIPGVGGAGVGLVKIADFGLSKVIFDASTKTPCGTVGYTAPEILRDERYSKGVDMWALGCVLYTLLSGFPPFFDDSPRGLTEKVANGQFAFLSPWWDDISIEAKDLVRRLLEVDTAKRYNIDEFLRHPWIKGRKFASRYRQMPVRTAVPAVHQVTTTTAADAANNIPAAEDVVMAETGPHASSTAIRDAAKEATHPDAHAAIPQPTQPPVAPAAVADPLYTQTAAQDEAYLMPNPNAPVPGWPTLPPILKTPAEETVHPAEGGQQYFPAGAPPAGGAHLNQEVLTPFTLPSPAVPASKEFQGEGGQPSQQQQRKQMVLSAPAPGTYDESTPDSDAPLPTPRRARRTPLPLPDGVTKEMLAAPFAIYQSLAEVREEEEENAAVVKHPQVAALGGGGKGNGGGGPVGTPTGQMGRQMGARREGGRNQNFNLDIGSSKLFSRRMAVEQA
ncbi:hypothetical protein HDV00_009864 [Rhizophlyctis rosea]|nr:hypothetical protein HDV00_009864 [Rhizophlyctis rosea]